MRKLKDLYSKYKQLSKKKRIQIIISASLTVLCMISFPVAAWFANYQKTGGMIKVNAPTVLTIGAGADDVSDMINLSNIDVEQTVDGDRITEGKYVFAVKGKYLSSYDLQISRTTNIPFTYEIYRVSVIDSLTGVTDTEKLASLSKGFGTTDKNVKDTLINNHYSIAEYESSEGIKYYYPFLKYEDAGNMGTFVNGTYLNDKGEPIIGNGEKVLGSSTFHAHNYDTYNNVNEYVEPLYWQKKEISVNDAGRVDANFTDYYVLRILWTEDFKNTKETDMIYITARRH